MTIWIQSEAEQLFHNDVREKKRTARGVHHKTGRNGYVGKMRFPSDIMSRKDKMRYRRSSKVMTTNMYEEIIPIEDFEQLETEEKKHRMLYWRSKFSNKEIQKEMGIANSPFYKIISELEIPRAPKRGGRVSKPKAVKTPTREIEEKETEAQQPVQEIIVNGMHLVFNGTYSAEQIIKQLSKFELLLDGEPDDFYIELKLVQKQPVKR